MLCPTCKGTEWVCENHRDKPWDETIEGGCICGAGAPCGTCGGIMKAVAIQQRSTPMSPLEVAAKVLEDHAKNVANVIAERAQKPSDADVKGIREFVSEQRLESARAVLIALAEARMPDFVEIDGERYAMPSPTDIQAFRDICRIIAQL